MLSIYKKTGYEGNIWRFYIINFIIGFRFIAPINLLYYKSFNISYTQIALIEFCAAVTIIILEVPTGIFADLLGRKRSMIVAYVLSVTAFLVMATGGSVVSFIIGWSISGAADAFESGADDALLYDSLKEINRTDEYLKIKSRFILIYSLTVIVGSISGAYFYMLNRRLPWFLFTGCIAVSGIIYTFMKEPPMLKEEDKEIKPVVNFKISLKRSVSNKNVIWLILFYIVLSIPTYAFASMMSQPYLVSRGFNIASLGFIFGAINGLSGFFSSLSYKIEKRLGEKASFLNIVILNTILFIAAGVLRIKGVFLIIIMLYTLRKYTNVVIDNYINKHVDSSSRATILSIQSFLYNVVITILVIFIGHMIDLYSINIVLILLGVFVGIASIPFLVIRYLRTSSADNTIESHEC